MDNTKDIYLDSLSLKAHLKEYASPKAKLTTMIRSKEILLIRRGLYLPGGNVSYSLKTLANKMYGPSYISFEYALSFYGLIPERVATITSATYKKNKCKRFDTPVGSFLFYPIPEKAYYPGVRWTEEQGGPFLVASMEKALCDTLYQHRRVKSVSQLTELLYEEMRIDSETLSSMDIKAVSELAPLYGKKVHLILVEWLRKEFSHA
ncbi:MAG: hypothetical protein JW795_15700 [Chitinivibrionales bacterium]|nr:hypothetical protein [Chitinivibrionales bacterium]